MIKLALVTLVSLGTSAAAAEEPVRSLTLDDSIRFALGYTTVVMKATRDLDLAGTQALQSYLQFLPALSASGNYGRSQGTNYLTMTMPTTVNGLSVGASYTLSASLNLFNGLADLAQWRSAHERRTAAEKTLLRAKQQISLDVAQSYLQVVLDQKLVKIAEKNLRASKDRQTLLLEQTAVGSRNKSDLFRQEAQTSADESFLISTQNKAVADEVTLLKKLRLRPDGRYVYREPALEGEARKVRGSGENIDEPAAVATALERRFDYQGVHLNAEAARADVVQARAGFYPKLDLGASYLTSGRRFDYQIVNNVVVTPAEQPDLDAQLRRNGGTLIALTLTWNVFDRWTTGVNVERAKVAASKARWDAEDYQRTVIGEVKQALNEYRRAIQQLETSDRGLRSAQKAYEVSAGRYEVGSLSYVDLATTQTALVQAEASRAQAVIGFELAKRSVEFALGTTATE